MISLENVSFGYGEQLTVKGITLKIKPGEFIALTGENGAGKTTLSKLIRGLLKPGFGRVLIDGEDIARIKASRLAVKMGFLFQNPDRQLCRNTVKEELLFSLEHAGVPEEKRDGLYKKTINDFGFDETASPFSLSRGERQKLALASVLICEPKILLLDEPTTGLDYSECIQIMDRIKALNEKGICIIMVCHDMELVLDYAKRVIVLSEGKLLADKAVDDIFYDEEIIKNARLLPPQIIQLSLKFPDILKGANNTLAAADALENHRRELP